MIAFVTDDWVDKFIGVLLEYKVFLKNNEIIYKSVESGDLFDSR